MANPQAQGRTVEFLPGVAILQGAVSVRATAFRFSASSLKWNSSGNRRILFHPTLSAVLKTSFLFLARTRFLCLLFACGIAASTEGADWRIEDQSPALDASSPLLVERKIVAKAVAEGFSSPCRIDLIWFHKDHHTFRVIDNGPPAQGRYRSLAEAMEQNGCLAGCNGGFFLENQEPSGLMIASGVATGRFGQGGLLSGVLLTSGRRNPYLLRRAEYDPEKYKATDLLQAGPYLVDKGATVAGLSAQPARRRTFVLHDGGSWFALGISEALSLAELGEVLADADFSPSRPVQRGLNLDGGTSSGIYLGPGWAGVPLSMEPIKRVRNFVGIAPR